MTATVLAPGEKDIRKVVNAVKELVEGRSNAVGTFTLTANAPSTTVDAMNCGAGSVPLLTPTTANAAAELGNGTLYVGTVSAGSFIVSHANNAQIDRTFKYAAFG